MPVNNWILNAAQQIRSELLHFFGDDPNLHHLTPMVAMNVHVESLVKIITEHVPKGVVFMTGKISDDPGVAYMPVPRCDTCLHWDNIGQTNKAQGVCRYYEHDPYSMASFTHMTTMSMFGCVAWKEKE